MIFSMLIRRHVLYCPQGMNMGQSMIKLPLYDGGVNWFGFRLWPFWIETHW